MSHLKPTKQDLEVMGQVASLEELVAKYSGKGGGKRSFLTTAFASVIAMTASRGKRTEPQPHEWLRAEHFAAAIGLTIEEAMRLDPSGSPALAHAGTLDEAQYRLCREVQLRLAAADGLHQTYGVFVKASEIGSAIEQAANYGVGFDAGYRMGLAAPMTHCEPKEFMGRADPIRALGGKFQALQHAEFKPARPPLRGAKHKVPKPE